MPINPLIALGVRAPDTTGQVQGFVDRRNLRQQQGVRNQQVQRQDARAQQVHDLNVSNAENQQKQQASAAQRQGWYEHQFRLKDALENGDIAGANQMIVNRAQLLTSEGRDPKNTLQQAQMLRADPKTALQSVTREINLGQQFGDLKAPAVPKRQGTLDARSPERQAQELALRSKLLSAEEEAQQARLGRARASSVDVTVQTSKGRTEFDKNFANRAADLGPGGGMADMLKGISQLDEVIGKLEAPGANLSGPWLALAPNIALSMVNPEAISVREGVEEIVQRNLRAVLGAQFTEKEGEKLIKRAFNPALGEPENLKRVKRLRAQMKIAQESQASAYAYFNENETLKGWGGKLPTMSDFNIEADVRVESPTRKIIDGTSFEKRGGKWYQVK